MCGVLGSMEQRQGEAFSAGWPVGGVFGKRVCVLVLMVCFVCMACCWVSRTARLLFYRSPLDEAGPFAGCGLCVFGLHLVWVLCVGWCVV